ncbi:TonB-dependent receptor domain-containing protein [Sphingobium boeckii]|uniref:Iron complex outermembrane receptor protein n=1 Tax=Sphingobium boeckii TaxID=1082345 RepID=A0A7W9AIL7_9SPHN|nr:iron complex outermembrane receptor protein [Sphingobium boeckii]
MALEHKEYSITSLLRSSAAPVGLVIALAGFGAGVAQAQEAVAPNAPAGIAEAEDQPDTEIVVTGTLLRGVAPGGSQHLTFSRDDAIASGAVNTSQLIAQIPQSGNFLRRPQAGINGSALSVNRPTLRYLGGNAAGGSSTLVLLDGHRLPGMGIKQTTPDTDAIAAGAIERVEIVTDGGSSTYGADAVGGVINFITRKRFDGVEVRGRYGSGEDYWTWDASATLGKSWDKGSIWLSYNYAKHDILYAADRDYVQNRDWINGIPADLNCAPGNMTIRSALGASTTYGLPSLTAGLGNRCDLQRTKALFPSESRHSVFLGFNVDLSDTVTFDTRLFYANRRSINDGGPLVGSATLTSTNPFYRDSGDANTGRAETVLFNFAPVLGEHNYTRTSLETWGVTNTISARLSDSWEWRALFNYGEGKSEAIGGAAATGVLAAAVTAGRFNPFNLADPINQPVLNAYANYRDYALGRNFLTNGRVVIDGTIATLPGGDIQLGMGFEIMREEYAIKIGQAAITALSSLATNRADRTTKAVFGELSIPIVGTGNRSAGIESLLLSASGRYDHYSDFGGTFNPKIGLTYEPVEWIAFRGNWGRSFQAPSLADSSVASPTTISGGGTVAYAAPGVPVLAGQSQIFLTGGGADLQPQKAQTWSVGADVRLPFARGVSLSATYYDINFRGQIASPPIFNPAAFYAQYPNNYKLYTATGGITAADVQKLAALASNPQAVAAYVADPSNVYSLADLRAQNLTSVFTSGLDFGLKIHENTGFGSIFANIAGNYMLTFEAQASTTSPITSTVSTAPRLNVTATAGAQIGGLRAQATLLHMGGFDVTPNAANLNQSRVDAYKVVNAFVQYDVGGEGAFKDLSFTLNLDNVFDKHPPLYRGALNGAYGFFGFNLGRIVQLGINKRF